MLRLVTTALLLAATLSAQDPQFTKDGRLIQPKDYREWIFLSSGVGMRYSDGPPADDPPFDNVFVNPSAYRSFLATGTWPEKTILILEVRTSASKSSINKGGHFQTDDFRLEANVKDSSRFADKWQFFALPASGEPGQALPKSAGCLACHSKNGAVDSTFVQFYPTLLPIAKAKGTFRLDEK